jgi:serine O-acetyltransferase
LTTFDLICTDLARAKGQAPPPNRWAALRLLLASTPAIKSLATIGFRLSHRAGRLSPLAGSALKALTHAITGADLDYRATVGPGFHLPHPTGVVISADTVVGERCTLHQGVTLGSRPEGSPSLGDDVNLAPGARVIGPIVLGDEVHVGSNAVVTRSFEDGHVTLVGIPAAPLARG